MRITIPSRKHFDVLDKIGDLTKRYSNLPDSYIKRSTEQVSEESMKTPHIVTMSNSLS